MAGASIAVIGGGFTGSLLSIHLLREAPRTHAYTCSIVPAALVLVSPTSRSTLAIS